MRRAGRTLARQFALALRVVGGFDLLDLFESKQQLIFRQVSAQRPKR
jgi:hypothetical protein